MSLPGSTVFNPFSVTNCLHCGDPIKQPRRGGRPRRYCDKPACRKAGSRLNRKLVAEYDDQVQRKLLRQLWQRLYDPTSITILEEILSQHGTHAATLATEALKREREALHKLIEARRIVAEAEKKEADKGNRDTQIEELQQRLQAVQEIEIRFHLDTKARHFKAWLSKQQHFPPESVAKRLFDDTRLPLYASRSFY